MQNNDKPVVIPLIVRLTNVWVTVRFRVRTGIRVIYRYCPQLFMHPDNVNIKYCSI